MLYEICLLLPLERVIGVELSGFVVLIYGFHIYRDGYEATLHQAAAAAAKSLQSCPTLCDPIDGSPSGSTVPGILQARTLEWVAISFSK